MWIHTKEVQVHGHHTLNCSQSEYLVVFCSVKDVIAILISAANVDSYIHNLLSAQLTTVLIFWVLNVALIKHMYSDGSGSGFRPSRGAGFVRPSSIN